MDGMTPTGAGRAPQQTAGRRPFPPSAPEAIEQARRTRARPSPEGSSRRERGGDWERRVAGGAGVSSGLSGAFSAASTGPAFDGLGGGRKGTGVSCLAPCRLSRAYRTRCIRCFTWATCQRRRPRARSGGAGGGGSEAKPRVAFDRTQDHGARGARPTPRDVERPLRQPPGGGHHIAAGHAGCTVLGDESACWARHQAGW